MLIRMRIHIEASHVKRKRYVLLHHPNVIGTQDEQVAVVLIAQGLTCHLLNPLLRSNTRTY